MHFKHSILVANIQCKTFYWPEQFSLFRTSTLNALLTENFDKPRVILYIENLYGTQDIKEFLLLCLKLEHNIILEVINMFNTANFAKRRSKAFNVYSNLRCIFTKDNKLELVTVWTDMVSLFTVSFHFQIYTGMDSKTSSELSNYQQTLLPGIRKAKYRRAYSPGG